MKADKNVETISDKLLEAKVAELFSSQLDAWPLFRGNHEKMFKAQDEAVSLSKPGDPWAVKKLLLSHRKASAGAKIDRKSLAERPCFLCKSNRPPEQEGLQRGDYEILVNPFPIAGRHLTIPAREHIAQRIERRIADMAELTVRLSEYCIFYNGPRCGASAPDHFHFQAFDKKMAGNLLKNHELRTIRQTEKAKICLSSPENSLFPYFLIDAPDPRSLSEAFGLLYHALPPDADEPMMNIAMIYDGHTIRAFVIPRKAHRPSCYGQEEGKMLVSPATVEMLGCFVLSRPEDMESLDYEKAREIYRELCLNEEEISKIVARL